MDAKVMKEMLENTGGLRSEFISVSAYYSNRTYTATFSFHPILLLVSVRYRNDSPLYAVAGEGTKDIYSIETSTPTLIMESVSWNDTTISFQVERTTTQMFYFWGIG